MLEMIIIMKGMNNLYNTNKTYSYYFMNTPWHDSAIMNNPCKSRQHPYFFNPQMNHSNFSNQYAHFTDEPWHDPRLKFLQYVSNENLIEMNDYGPEPFVVNIEEATTQNNTFRTALWTGDHLQLTLMSINVGEDIGLEVHHDLDQFIRIEEGQGNVRMGDSNDNLDFEENVFADFVFIIPAGKWHNLINTGNIPLKLYSIYAPPQHPHGTVHVTKAEAEAAEENHDH